ncbi:MAG: L-glutamate gamma-semialdehyde dehydrogenase [Phycisphaerales bacterium]|nr:L-glutamate gamma-semialdehyde dehydrogenase [Phycisphaerales bacterium]
MVADPGKTHLNELTKQIGHEVFERMRAAGAPAYRWEFWEERIMRFLMADEWFKVQAFRFIDVLPMMHDGPDVARHLREYFAKPPHRRAAGRSGAKGRGGGSHHSGLGGATELAELEPRRGFDVVDFVAWATNFRSTRSPLARLAAGVARGGAVGMSHRFIAGSTPEQAERNILRMRDEGLAFTIDVLGEAAVSEPESEHYQQTYMQLITTLSKHAGSWSPVELCDRADGRDIPRVNVSVKLTSLYSQSDAIDPAGTKKWCKERLRPLLREAMKYGSHLHIDMEHYAIKDLTLELAKEIFSESEFREYPHFGVVLQAYLKDNDRDVEDMIAYARQRGVPIWIRLVKGAYWDTETVMADQYHWPTPVFEQKWQSDASYERATRRLLENWRVIHTAFGSHNVRSLAHALALKRTFEVPSWACELQMLYGMGDPIKRACVAMGERSRVYTPYGELLPGMAYLIRRLLENTANESFLRHSGSGDIPEDKLLEDPAETGSRTPPHEKRPVLRFEYEEPLMDPFVNIPNSDFSRSDMRDKMKSAIHSVRSRLGQEYPLVIGNERVATGKWENSLNPSNPSEIVGRFAMADAAATERCVQVAYDALPTWRRTPPGDRADYLFHVARLMERDRFELNAIASLECGKTWREADADISEAIDFCNFYGKEMIRMAENVRRRDLPGETNELFYAPRGVVGVIAPWNFPLAILCGMSTAALVTGNTVIMKPAEQSSIIAARLMALFIEAGLPAGVLNYLPGSGEVVGDALVRHAKVAMIAFTGSRSVGCAINRTAAEGFAVGPALKKVIAEMGGKNAAIVDSDADLDEAVKGVLHGAFGYAGQKCSACSRAIVLDGAYERFLPRLVEAARSLTVGPADDQGTFVPPVIDKESFERIRRYIEIGKSESRCVLETDTSVLVARTGGYYVGPTIFADVSPNARIAQEEIFGPVLAVIRARDMDQAIEIFNGTDYALTGGIFSRSPANLERARHELECGNLYINRKITGALVDAQPFGGFRMSGIGSKAGGPDYLIQFCEPRCVTENTLRRGFAPSEELVGAV